MKAEDVVEILSGAIEKAREEGVTQIALEDLSSFAQGLKIDSENSPEDISMEAAELEKYKVSLASVLVQHEFEHQVSLEMLRATVTTAQSALKTALLINGGAAIALLAFIGSALSEESFRAQIPLIANALTKFVMGVLVAALASGFTYLSQSFYGEDWGKNAECWAELFKWLAIAFGFGAFALFGYGAWIANIAFVGQ